MTKHVINKSNHDRLVAGAGYSIRALSLITGINTNTLSNRLLGKDEFTDYDIRTIDVSKSAAQRSKRAQGDSPWPRLESGADKLSSKFLRAKL